MHAIPRLAGRVQILARHSALLRFAPRLTPIASVLLFNELLIQDTSSEGRPCPLDKINDRDVNKLGLAWAMDLDNDRGLEATPIVVDGVRYSTLSWSRVFAVGAASGRKLGSSTHRCRRSRVATPAATW
jgi:glucose dehydrogenase